MKLEILVESANAKSKLKILRKNIVAIIRKKFFIEFYFY